MRVATKAHLCLVVTACMGGYWAPSNAYAQEVVPTGYQYAVKMACTLLTNFGFGDAFAPGRYRTVVNIHNSTEKNIKFTRKFALAGEPGQEASEFSVTPYKSVPLGPDGAISYDCFNVAGFFCPINGVCVDFTAIDGFLVINSPVPLDVTAIYTANPNGAEVSSMDVETIAPRKTHKKIKTIADKGESTQNLPRIQMEPFKRQQKN